MSRKVIALAILTVALVGLFAALYVVLPETSIELRIFVAASLTRVVRDDQPAFESEHNVKLLFNTGGSDALYQQIVSGSPADVFMAADVRWLERLNESGLLYDHQYWKFASNSLVVIVSTEDSAKVATLLDLTRPGVRIAVAAWTVPAGRYTNMTLTKIDAAWGNESNPNYRGPEWKNYTQRVIRNIITYEPDVEQVVTKVQTGVADAGFAYLSDVTHMGESKMKYIPIPPDVNVEAKYGIGVPKESRHPAIATEYVNFWLSEEGQDLLAKYGFGSSLVTSFLGANVSQMFDGTVVEQEPERSIRLSWSALAQSEFQRIRGDPRGGEN